MNDKKYKLFEDDEFIAITNEHDQIRKHLNMYISTGGTDGAFHLFKEVYQNAVDECQSPRSPGKKIDVTFCQELCEFSVTDDGRGIPFDRLYSILTQKHTSTKTKYETVRTKDMAGMNGVGLTATAALSDSFTIVSYRGDMKKTLQLIDGKVIEYEPEKIKKETYGTTVSFIPSPKYLGKIKLDIDMVKDFLRKMTYIVPAKIKTNAYFNKKEKDTPEMIKYRYQGLSADVKYTAGPGIEFEPICCLVVTPDFDIEFAFSYDRDISEKVINSYCNFVITTSGGTHETAVERAICEFFAREGKRMDEKNKNEIIYDDCRKGLIISVNCKHIDPSLEGQTKTKLGNSDVLENGKKLITNELQKYFSTNNKALKDIIDYLRQVSKARQAANQIRGISTKQKTTFLDDASIKGYVPVSNRNSTGYKELLIVEGDSARNEIYAVRDNKTQALYGPFGIDNTFGSTLTQVMMKTTFRNLVNILGCGIGKDFNIANLKFDKIIICTDADIDGFNLASLFMAFFLQFMPEIISHGKLYRALSPLYLFDEKKIRKYVKTNSWVYDKRELTAIQSAIIANNVDLYVRNIDGEETRLTKKQIADFLQLNYNYKDELKILSTRSACQPVVLEHVVQALIEAVPHETFPDKIQIYCPELNFNPSNKTLTGSFNKESVTLIVDDLFIKMSKKFADILYQNSSQFVAYRNISDPTDKEVVSTIGQFFDMMEKTFQIKIEKRIKGLGELPVELMHRTTINPKIRRLIRLTMGNITSVMETFEVLHGRSPDMRAARRKMLEESNITYDEIDN